jgi:hypothetical protein
MKLPRMQFTLRRLAIAVAVISVGLVPLNDPARPWLGALMYLKIGILIAATFLARYGHNRDWWFGFATLGWAHLIISVPGLWNAVYALAPQAGFDVFDLAGSAADLVKLWANRQEGRARNWYAPEAAVISFWMTMGASAAGGSLSVIISAWCEEREQTTLTQPR